MKLLNWFRLRYKQASSFGKFVIFGIPLIIIIDFTIKHGLIGFVASTPIALFAHVVFCLQLSTLKND